jgi:hypothetical protein
MYLGGPSNPVRGDAKRRRRRLGVHRVGHWITHGPGGFDSRQLGYEPVEQCAYPHLGAASGVNRAGAPSGAGGRARVG